MLENMLPCKRTFIVNATGITVKAAKTSQSKSMWNHGAYRYQKYCNTGAPCCELH